jgi:hypothetical protein
VLVGLEARPWTADQRLVGVYKRVRERLLTAEHGLPARTARPTAVGVALGFTPLDHLVLDLLLELLAGLALDQSLCDGLDFFVLGRVLADTTADDIRAAENGLVSVPRVPADVSGVAGKGRSCDVTYNR